MIGCQEILNSRQDNNIGDDLIMIEMYPNKWSLFIGFFFQLE